MGISFMSKVGEFITPARLKSERFWTDKLIKEHLGDPDRLVSNPHYRSGPEMRLYEKKRVVRIEKRKKVLAAISLVAERREKRSAAALKSCEIRREKLVAEQVSSVKTFFDDISLSKLINLGMSRHEIYSKVDIDTKRRWAVNFARHELTEYDGVRYYNAGCVGVHAAAEAVRNEVLSQIATTWPDLSEECERQQR